MLCIIMSRSCKWTLLTRLETTWGPEERPSLIYWSHCERLSLTGVANEARFSLETGLILQTVVASDLQRSYFTLRSSGWYSSMFTIMLRDLSDIPLSIIEVFGRRKMEFNASKKGILPL